MTSKTGISVISAAIVLLLVSGSYFVIGTGNVSASHDGDYAYSVSGGHATITGYTGPGGVIVIPSTLGGFVTGTIGEKAFQYNHNITSVTIPGSVTSISDSAFLLSTTLISVTIPGSVVSIGNNSFEGCMSLTSLSIPIGVVSLGQKAFWNCASLASVTFGAPSAVTKIGNNSFGYCTSLTSVAIPDSVTSIGYAPFLSCTSLTSIEVNRSNLNYASVDGVLFNKGMTTLIQSPSGRAGTVSIPNSVLTVGNSSFFHSASLASLTIPDSVTTIGDNAFEGCPNITSLSLGSNVTSIGTRSFWQCSSLTSLTIPGNVTKIGDNAFTYCTALTSMTISGHATIGDAAFARCTSLIYVNITGRDTIGDAAFADCSSLTSLNMFTGVSIIGAGAFQNCIALTSVTIPSSVTTIGDHAFSGCTSLTSISFLGMVAPTSVSNEWASGSVAGVFGHAFADSNFPPSGSVVTFHGLTMGSNIPASLPAAPIGLTATQGDNRIILNWTSPANTGGSKIDYYAVFQNGVDVNHTSANSIVITGLTNGKNYTFALAAHNSAGIGNRSPSQVISPVASNSNNAGTNSGNDGTVYFMAVILVALAFIAIFFVIRRNREHKEQ